MIIQAKNIVFNIVIILGHVFTDASILDTNSSQYLVTFIFGDSLTEVGNNNYLQYSLAKSNFPWYGIDFEGGIATGRFTNGRTIGDIISAKLGIESPPPYLSMSPNDDKLLNGVNYASGGAGILNDTGLYFIQRLTLDDQINSFGNTTLAIKGKIGEAAANKLLNKAIYFIGIGSNDYVNNFLQPFMAAGQEYSHDEFLDLLLATLQQQFVRLYQLGARKVIFHGLGPLGCIPSQRVKSRRGICLNQVNRWVQKFNLEVQNLCPKLNKRLPTAEFQFADTYKDVLDLIDHPQKYDKKKIEFCVINNNDAEILIAVYQQSESQDILGATNVTLTLESHGVGTAYEYASTLSFFPSHKGFKVSNTSCCNVDTSIGGLCLQNSKLCKNRAQYVFWDAFHPSDAANALLASKLFSNLFPNSHRNIT